jgi:hypothetical protein
MTAPEFEARIVAWARRQPDIEALVQIGSRVQPGASVDEWSDWDFHLIVRSPVRFLNIDWPAQIAPCWGVYMERTERAALKFSAIFEGGFEVDFVLLVAWQMKLVYTAMRFPRAQRFLPGALSRGINNIRLVTQPGCRVILGNAVWEKRITALKVVWPGPGFTREDFQRHTAAFWRHAVWVFKKTARAELRAAMRWHHVTMHEHVYVLLQEEARLAGRRPRPEARKAEQWLDETRLRQTAISTGPDQRTLANALLAEMTLFIEVTASVAASRGFPVPDYSAVNTWLHDELAKVIANSRRS